MKLTTIIFLIGLMVSTGECHRVETRSGGIAVQSSIVRTAMRDLGVTEDSWRAREMLAACGIKRRAPWCAAAVSEWLAAAGCKVSRTAAVSDLKKQARSWKEVSPSPGAVVFFRWSHVAIVKEITKKGFYAIEGNCSNAVRIRFHPFKHAIGFYKI